MLYRGSPLSNCIFLEQEVNRAGNSRKTFNKQTIITHKAKSTQLGMGNGRNESGDGLYYIRISMKLPLIK